MLPTVRVQVQDRVTVVELDRPARAHAYDAATLDALEAAFASVATPAVVVASTGHGAFCGGADRDALRRAEPEDALRLRSQSVFDGLARAPWVSVAAIQGAAVGGGFELALACDLRVGGPRARFWLPEPTLGLIPAAGGTARLPGLVGGSRARALILGGLELDAPTAQAWGLLVEVADDVRAAALGLAGRVAARDAGALALAKAVLGGSATVEQLQAERLAQAVLYGRRS